MQLIHWAIILFFIALCYGDLKQVNDSQGATAFVAIVATFVVLLIAGIKTWAEGGC